MHSTKKKTTEEFIKEAKIIHGDKYDYSKVNYINIRTPVTIICPIHGEFQQTPKCHLNGHGCYECAKKNFGKTKRNNVKRLKKRDSIFKRKKEYTKLKLENTDDFVFYSKKLHDNKYDYSKSVFITKKKKLCIICPEHGEFWQTPESHMKGHGCPKCGKKVTAEKQRISKNDFIQFALEKYGDKYDYSKVEYEGYNKPVCIICPEHGEFWQTPKQHLKACGCKGCVNEKKREIFSLKNENFIKRAEEIFNKKYSYANVKYINNSTKVLITCPKHGDFSCTPSNHLKGRGCPMCKAEENVYENRMLYFLETIFNKDDIIRQYKCEWLSNNKSLDFYIPKYKIAIEHQGSQHFKPVEFLGGINKYKRCVELDKEKYAECKKNGINLFYFTYELHNVENYIDKVYTEETDLKREIMKIINKF